MSAVSGSETQRALVAPGQATDCRSPAHLRMRSDAPSPSVSPPVTRRPSTFCMSATGQWCSPSRWACSAPPRMQRTRPRRRSRRWPWPFSTKPPAELRPWLIRVARNASIDTTRRRRHRLLTLDGEIPDDSGASASAGQAELAVVLDGIRELPEGQRMALLMRELGGHSYARSPSSSRPTRKPSRD